MTERYLQPVRMRALSDDDIRQVLEALFRYFRVEVLVDSTPEATSCEIRRLRRRLGRPPKTQS